MTSAIIKFVKSRFNERKMAKTLNLQKKKVQLIEKVQYYKIKKCIPRM